MNPKQKTLFSLWSVIMTVIALTPTVFASNPNTGDNSIVGIMLVVLGVSVVLMVLFFLTGKKKNKK